MRRVAGWLAFSALFACGGRANSDTAVPLAGPPLAASAAVAGRALGDFYRAENDGVTDAYLERAAARGRSPARSERCRLPTGALSTRPTVLANPPLSEGAIAQREALFAELAAYANLLDALTAGRPKRAVSDAAGALRERSADLVKAANEHGSGDLFIEDDAAALAGDVRLFGLAGNRAAGIRVLNSMNAVVRASSAVLAGDFARQRTDTIDATTLAYDQWRLRVQSGAPAAGAGERADPPFCSEPAIFDRPPARDAAGALTARGAQLYRRMNVARAVSFSEVFMDMTTFDDDQLLALREPTNFRAIADASASRERLSAALRSVVRASSGFSPRA